MVLIGLWCAVSGCSSTPRQGHQPDTQANPPRTLPSDRTAGYSLLYQLLSDEAKVDKILLIKREQPELRTLVKEIATKTALAKKQLETFAAEDPSVGLKAKPLPAVEQKARDSIGSARGKELIFGSSGQLFEFKLLLTQVEALGYGTHLAKALSEVEPNTKRSAYLLQVSQMFNQLHTRTADFIFQRYKD